MSKIKKLICGLLMECMMITVITIAPQTAQATTTASGTDGEIHWEIKGDTLTLSAVEGTEGRMKDYSNGSSSPDSPWDSLMKNVKTVIVKDGVTKLGTSTARGSFDSVIIAGTVKEIQGFSFGASIKNVYLNDGVDNLEACSFLGRVENVFISKTTEHISPYAFSAPADGNTTYLKNVYGYESAEFFVNELMTLVEETRDDIRDSGMIGIAQDVDSCRWDENASVTFVSLSKNSILSKAKVTSSISINKGKSKSIKVTLPTGFNKVTKYSGNPADVKVTFKSSNKKIATVSSSGKVTGKKKGTVKITVTMKIKDGAKKTLTTKVTVK